MNRVIFCCNIFSCSESYSQLYGRCGLEKTRRSGTTRANKPERDLRCVERENEKRNDPRETKRGGGGQSLPRENSLSPESTSKNDIGRQLDRVIEELFEVESKQGQRRKGKKQLLSLWQEDGKTSPSSEDELEDIEALLGNDGDEDSSNTDEEEDDSAPFYGFPTSEDARPTRLVALIKTFESGEEAFDKNITTFGALEDANQEEGQDELGNCKEEEWKHELFLTTAWRKTQKA